MRPCTSHLRSPEPDATPRVAKAFAELMRRLGYERYGVQGGDWGSAPEPSRTPTGLACFPAENLIVLRHLAERSNNLVRWTEFERGGHFAAMEVPELLVGDVRAFFRQLREA
nr:hypothetical protein [Catenulispora rubra]